MKFHVEGVPAPQGSKRHVGNGRMIESSKKVKPWREAVVVAAKACMGSGEAFSGGVAVTITFYLPRPKAHYNARGELKPTAPSYVINRPDVDKLARSTLDGLTTAGVFSDDSRVVRLELTKLYGTPGADIEIHSSEATGDVLRA